MKAIGETRILIVDDSPLWIKQGQTLLGQAGYENITGLVVSDPKIFTAEFLPGSLIDALSKADVLLVDKDLGEGITSTRLICVVRDCFPKLPVVRWTGGWDEKPYMRYLGISCIEKPTRGNEDKFVAAFESAANEQTLILSGPMAIFAVLDETVKPSEFMAQVKTNRLQQIAEIAQLSDKDRVESDQPDYPWMITGRSGSVTKHELGHCICDGNLTAEEIRLHLSALQKVIAKFKAAGEIDERFRICAEFIEAGNLDELDLIKGCY